MQKQVLSLALFRPLYKPKNQKKWRIFFAFAQGLDSPMVAEIAQRKIEDSF